MPSEILPRYQDFRPSVEVLEGEPTLGGEWTIKRLKLHVLVGLVLRDLVIYLRSLTQDVANMGIYSSDAGWTGRPTLNRY
jgi:hypothetical protein